MKCLHGRRQGNGSNPRVLGNARDSRKQENQTKEPLIRGVLLFGAPAGTRIPDTLIKSYSKGSTFCVLPFSTIVSPSSLSCFFSRARRRNTHPLLCSSAVRRTKSSRFPYFLKSVVNGVAHYKAILKFSIFPQSAISATARTGLW